MGYGLCVVGLGFFIHHSLLATHYSPFANRQSPVANSLPFWLGRSLALPLLRITLYALRSHPFRSFHGIIATNMKMVRGAMFGVGCDVLSAECN